MSNLDNQNLFDKNQEHTQHNSLICSFSNTTCSLSCIITLKTTNRTNGKTVNNRFKNHAKYIEERNC